MPATTGLRAMADLATPMSLRVGATLRIADHILAGATTATAIAARCDADAQALDRLLLHWTWLGLLQVDQGGAGYGLTDLGAELVSDHPRNRREWLDIHGSVGRGDLAFVELLHTVRTGRSAYAARYGVEFWDDLQCTPTLRRSFDSLMDQHVQSDAADIASSYPWDRHRYVVDVAGGNGALLEMILRKHPTLSGCVLELDGPLEDAQARFGSVPALHGRAAATRGSLFEPLPVTGDVYVLSAILHDWPDDDAHTILAGVRAAMGPEACLLVVEAVGKDGESVDPRMDLRMLAYTGGRERGVRDLARLAAGAGLALERTHPVAGKDYMAILEFRVADGDAG